MRLELPAGLYDRVSVRTSEGTNPGASARVRYAAQNKTQATLLSFQDTQEIRAVIRR